MLNRHVEIAQRVGAYLHGMLHALHFPDRTSRIPAISNFFFVRLARSLYIVQ